MNTTKKVAVVTGANRGLGFETSRQLAKKGYQVILTSRDEAKGKAAAEKLQAEGLDVTSYPLDVASDQSSQKLAEFINKQFGKLDVLVNNAGILIDF
jgi:NAD(P)-dependent dehydrogenase (short-subunit alcohol dehydrogenase family)